MILDIREGPKPQVHIDQERCAGCTECLKECPRGCLSLDPGRWVVSWSGKDCAGCRSCQRVCPYGNIRVEGPFRWLHGRLHPLARDVEERLADFHEVSLGYTREEAFREAHRCLGCPRPRCREACPAGNDIPGFIDAVRRHDLPGAMAILRRTTNLPAVCSRVCHQAQQCEGACVYAREGGEAVAIGQLERFVADWCREHTCGYVGRDGRWPTGRRAAVVGSGPAGLSAAEDLARQGHAVTVYEALPVLGGVMAWGIPTFILPWELLEHKLGELECLGVEFQTGMRVGVDRNLEQLLAEHDAVLLSTGAGQDNLLGLPGAELAGVCTATGFLSRSKDCLRGQGEHSSPGRTLVIGAGNTAMDVARTARRLGSKEIYAVDILPEEVAPVRRDELAKARDEGVCVWFSTSVARFLPDAGGQLGAAELVGTKLQEDPSGRRRAVPVPGTDQILPVDTVVFAMGYRARGDALAGFARIAPDARGLIPVDPGTGRTAAAGVWAAGDAATGPGALVRAMVAGKRAARDMDAYLRGAQSTVA
ncbi:MAG: FAD-dependent oxidoreductase [Thermaerobacter sp.]|nr:FAD-dependent oxidoreductase [Thermaerobacter sp.]